MQITAGVFRLIRGAPMKKTARPSWYFLSDCADAVQIGPQANREINGFTLHI